MATFKPTNPLVHDDSAGCWCSFHDEPCGVLISVRLTFSLSLRENLAWNTPTHTHTHAPTHTPPVFCLAKKRKSFETEKQNLLSTFTNLSVYACLECTERKRARQAGRKAERRLPAFLRQRNKKREKPWSLNRCVLICMWEGTAWLAYLLSGAEALQRLFFVRLIYRWLSEHERASGMLKNAMGRPPPTTSTPTPANHPHSVTPQKRSKHMKRGRDAASDTVTTLEGVEKKSCVGQMREKGKCQVKKQNAEVANTCK